MPFINIMFYKSNSRCLLRNQMIYTILIKFTLDKEEVYESSPLSFNKFFLDLFLKHDILY